MFGTSPYQILLKRWKLLAVVGIFFAAITVGVGLLFPLEYRSDAQILIIYRASYGVDPYTTVKSAERIGENLAQVVKTSDFFDKVSVSSQYNLDQSRFTDVSARLSRKRWEKMVDASVVLGTGILNISTYHPNPEQAKMWNNAVNDVLINQGVDYVGSNVSLKVINPPVVTVLPIRPNLLLNGIAGFVLGVMFMGVLVVRKGGRVIV